MVCAEVLTVSPPRGCQAPLTSVATAKFVGGWPASSASVYARVIVVGAVNCVPVGPISQTGPTAPGTVDTAGVIVTVTFCGSAPAGILICAAPSPVATVPPEAPTTAAAATSQAPALHTSGAPLHAGPTFCHVPAALQICGCRPAHRSVAGAQATHNPA